MKKLAVAVMLCFAVHAADHFAHHDVYALMWMCNVACPIVAVGLWFEQSSVLAIGVAWIAAGMPLWLAGLASGESLMLTSLLTHIGVLALGVVGVRRLGWPRGTWWKALIARLALQPVTRWVTPRAANVNTAFAAWSVWPQPLRWYPLYFAIGTVGFALAFFALDAIAARALR